MVKEAFENTASVEDEDEGPQITSYADMQAAIDANAAVAAAKRAEVESREGGLASFRERLIFEPVVSDEEHKIIEAFKNENTPAAERPSEQDYNAVMQKVDARVAEFYQPYEASFPIKAEREAQGGLSAEDAGEGFFGIVTERNFDKDLQEIHGNFREMMYIVRDPDTKAPIGGMNFIVYPPKDGQPLEEKYAATVHSVYVFFDPAHRSLGLARPLMATRNEIAADYVAKVEPELASKSSAILTISEQNIPEQMDPISYMTDSGLAVLQEQRLEKWYSMGYNRLNFEEQEYDGYVQPALEEGGEVCDVLSLNAYATPVDFGKEKPEIAPAVRVDGVAASTLKHHLHGFFGTSVVGDANAGNPQSPDHDETMVDAMAKLDRMGDGKIPTFGYEESMDKLANMRPVIANFLATATKSEIHSEEQIGDLIAVREERAARLAAAQNAPSAKPSQP